MEMEVLWHWHSFWIMSGSFLVQSKDVEIDALKIYVALQFVSQAVLESYDGTNVGKLDQVKVGCCAQTG